MIHQSSDGTTGGDSSESSGDLISDLSTELEVTLNRWSVGQLGLADIIVATGVVVGGFVVAWLLRRLIQRAARGLSGTAQTAAGTVGKLAGAAVHLISAALALEILGFSLGPILMLIVVVIVVVLLMRPMITNLSDGLLLQLRGALDNGDLVLAAGGVLGVVEEITTRTTVIATSDGRRVHIPNSEVLNDVIVNYSSSGHLRSSFEVTVGGDENLELVVSTMRLALAQVDEILNDPQPEVEVARLVGRLVVVRALVWHAPTLRSRRAAIDGGIRAVVADLTEAGIALDGPSLAELQSDGDSMDGGREPERT